ncbi:MAG: chromosome segregation protein SMC, partial [Eggerthellaceae bacterium]|nr:chromosome segregation protein SMC [Eggerthellaceae bacterium]
RAFDMYLKSLVLKGFKSFADRTVINLEPGITAIVGPNGSGKSNISDAVIWVLGERNAKYLRGQNMEDVIFSGSGSRKPVASAEVELVLDNSDGTLPVDYSEVTIGRRMYRTGESEYFINGVPSRRLDILEILHDSGLGMGTHSIISQGQLDAILKSKPEERRSLIEEAAGVLKHKQNKEKSEQKLELMEQHLTRVRDVTAEVQRQLGPLERKASKALAYEEVFGELSGLELSLAVDDLRILQDAWNKNSDAEASLTVELEEKREAIRLADAKLEEIQSQMSKASIESGEIAGKFRAVSAVSERIDSGLALMRERKRNAVARIEETESSIVRDSEKLSSLQSELVAYQSQADEANKAHLQIKESLALLRAQSDAAKEERKRIEEHISQNEQVIRDLVSKTEVLRKNATASREAMSESEVRIKVLQARLDELNEQLPDMQKSADEAKASYALLIESSKSIEAQAKEAADDLAHVLRAERETSRLRDEVRLQLANAQVQCGALEAIEQSEEVFSKAAEQIKDVLSQKGKTLKRLSEVINVQKEYQAIAEALLGDDVNAFMIEREEVMDEVFAVLDSKDEPLSGQAHMLMDARSASLCAQLTNERASVLKANPSYVALVDCMTYPDAFKNIIGAMLGDVIVCPDMVSAYKASKEHAGNVRFVSIDGCIFYPFGKVSYVADDDTRESTLSRQSKIRALKEQIEGLQSELDAHVAKHAKLSDELKAAQERSMTLSREAAESSAKVEVALSQAKELNMKFNEGVSFFENTAKDIASLSGDISSKMPMVLSIESQIEEAEETRKQTMASLAEWYALLPKAKEDEASANEALNAAEVRYASTSERASYAKLVCDARKNEIRDAEERRQTSQIVINRKKISIERISSLIVRIESLRSGIDEKAVMAQSLSDAQTQAVSGLAQRANEAHMASRQSHDAWDTVNAKLSEVRIEKGRLELKVRAATDTIEVTCKTPLEIALRLEPLQNREEVEDRAVRLRKRIANMGTINPDAAREYKQLKSRFDFLVSQLSDMDAAKRALTKISRVIDDRMKTDFIETFDAVNQNFKEIFALLFPGGYAQLSLDNPDDLENAGIEISAQPLGKKINKLSLLSGGEKSLTALALLFAIYRHRNAPFYILDEVEASLDDTNLRRLVSYVDAQRQSIQLIMITHQRRTMEIADTLYGISMQKDGVTKAISQKLEYALKSAR